LALQVLFIGTAGSGKSSLTASFSDWASHEMGLRVGCINLDPGCVHLPYKPDFDVRELFTVASIMEAERLGPNGAMIRAAEYIEERSEEIVERLSKVEADLILIDTPSQMEIFVFRQAGPKVAEAMARSGRTVAVYILDPALAETATGLVVAATLQAATQLRLGTPTVLVLNKADLSAGRKLDRLLTDFSFLERSILREQLGASKGLALGFLRAIREVGGASRIVKVSAKTGEGMESLYDLIHEAFCVCGEL